MKKTSLPNSCGSGSVCFWASRIGIHLVRGTDPDLSIIKSKIERKTLIPTVLKHLYNFLSLKNDINIPVPSKSNKQKNLLPKHWLKKVKRFDFKYEVITGKH
jgi:hypothetical protein